MAKAIYAAAWFGQTQTLMTLRLAAVTPVASPPNQHGFIRKRAPLAQARRNPYSLAGGLLGPRLARVPCNEQRGASMKLLSKAAKAIISECPACGKRIRWRLTRKGTFLRPTYHCPHCGVQFSMVDRNIFMLIVACLGVGMLADHPCPH